MRTFTLAGIDPTRWKNGGGNTREIAVWPPGAGMDDFVWRLSVADIEADGPFSAFRGIDRQIVLLDGAGVMLRADDGSFSHRLVQPGAPFAFSGDTGLQAALLDGATRDFNVMTRRGRCRARVDAFRQGFAVGTGADTVCLLAVSGTWLAQDAQPAVALDAGQGVLYPAGEPAGRQVFAPGADDAADEALCLCVTLEMESDQ